LGCLLRGGAVRLKGYNRRLAGQDTDRTIEVRRKVLVMVEETVDKSQGDKKDYPRGQPSGQWGKISSGRG
jgi:hypothetical protein